LLISVFGGIFKRFLFSITKDLKANSMSLPSGQPKNGCKEEGKEDYFGL
jgi:hypothetical protein